LSTLSPMRLNISEREGLAIFSKVNAKDIPGKQCVRISIDKSGE